VLAVGKAAGAERELCARYAGRAAQAGRAMGVHRVTVEEVPDAAGPGRAAEEGARLLKRRPQGVLVALDERGAAWSSADLAEALRRWADRGAGNAAFAIGGADGHPDAVREAADAVVALSAMTLPHLLARVVILEQIYRAITICVGHPYHRA